MQRTWEDRNWPYLPALALFPITIVLARIALGPDPKGSWDVPTWCGAAAALTGLAVTATLSGVVSAWKAPGLSTHSLRLALVQFIAGAGLQLLFSFPTFSDFPHWLGLPWLAGAIIVALTTMSLGVLRRRGGGDAGASNAG